MKPNSPAGFALHAPFKPKGDQPHAIAALIKGLRKGYREQTLLGVTGSGKTMTMAGVIAAVQKPTLVISHNKTLAAQLAAEFREFFPHNAVHYFVSYYDYYQPEAYIPQTDTYIQKDADINEEIDRLRHAATQAVLTRRDVIIVASVSCIYGIGTPENFQAQAITLTLPSKQSSHALGFTPTSRREVLVALTNALYQRNDTHLPRGSFRVRGDVVDIHPVSEDNLVRIEFWGEQIERINLVDAITGVVLKELPSYTIFPAKLYLTPHEKLARALRAIRTELAERVRELKAQGKLLAAQRLEQRTNYDLEMLETVGYVSGIENYSRHLDGRAPGEPPATLLDYFPPDFLTFIDESHMAIPQLRGMVRGDYSRKKALIEHGFRLPSAWDNRPLTFAEFEARLGQRIYVSATPAPFECKRSAQVVRQIIRPTGLLDPSVEVRPTTGQVEDLLGEIKKRIKRKQRVLITTLTKRLAEELAEYLAEMQIKCHYLHADIDTLERVEILQALRAGRYDVVVGINLLREGLDLPEVSLVVILDADKEGYLRNTTALLQVMGRAARHVEGHVIMYADRITPSMRAAIRETLARRRQQATYNRRHNITPRSISKPLRPSLITTAVTAARQAISAPPREEFSRIIKELESKMRLAAANLEFEQAAQLRDLIAELRQRKRKQEFQKADTRSR